MSIGLNKKNIGLMLLGIIFLLFAIMVNAALNGVTLDTPQSNENISGTYTLSATVTGNADNVTFYWSNDTGTTWYLIGTNNTAGSYFTYSMDTSAIGDDTGLYFNATAMNDTTIVSSTNTGITVDNTPPLISPTTPSDGENISGTVWINATWSDETSGVETARYIWSNSTWAGNWIPLNGTNDTAELKDGDYNITYNATDYLGNSNTTYITVNVDNTKPTIDLVYPPPGSSLTGSAEIMGVASDARPEAISSNDTRFTWNNTYNDWGFTNNTPLSDGYYALNISANDSAGNENFTISTFTLDNTPPSVVIIYPQNITYPSNITLINTSATDSTGVDKVLAEVDDSSNVTLVFDGSFYINNTINLGEGTHRIRIYANDTLSNMNSTEEVYFTVDNTPPYIEYIPPTPGNETNISGAKTINVSSPDSDLDTIIIYVDSVQVQSCPTSPCEYSWDTTGYSDGLHNFTATANDTVGNINSSLSVRTVTVDNTPPDIIPITPAEGEILKGTIDVSAVWSDDATQVGVSRFRWMNTTDTGTWANLNGTLDTTLLNDGSYNINFWANDSAGNINQTNVSITVDNTPPKIDFIYPTENNDTSFNRNWIFVNTSVQEDNLKNITFRLYNKTSLINETTYASTREINFTDLDEGYYYFNATAFDQVDQENHTETIYQILDGTNPSIYYNPSTSQGNLSQNWILINVTASDLNKDEVLLNWSGALETFDNNIGDIYWENKTGLSDGNYVFNTFINDTAGNQNSTPLRLVNLDNSAPQILIESPANASVIQNNSIILNVSVVESYPDTLWWQLDSNGTNITGCTSCNSYETTIPLSDGYHYIEVWTNDSSDNLGYNITHFTIANTKVTIIVNDSSNSEPIQGASVVLNSTISFTNTTDSLGEAELKLDSTKLYNLTVTKSGYITYTSLNQNFSEVQERNILLTGNSSLYGYVKEVGKDPIVADIKVYDNSSGILKYQTSTDSYGFYNISISGAFSYYVKFSVTGYITKILGNYTGVRELNTSLYQQGFGSFTFKVLDYMNERPIPDANITVEWSDNETGVTNSSGVSIIEVPAGAVCNVYISTDGYLSNNSLAGLSVAEGEDNYIEAYLRGDSKIFGYVRDEESSRGVVASLEFWDENNTEKLNWDNSYFYSTTSGSDGYYEVYYPSTLSGLSLYVHANASGYYSKNVSTGGSQEVGINLRGSAVVTGKVVDGTNPSLGISGATVQLLDSSAGEVVYEKTTQTDGNFTIYIEDGIAYTLKISKEGYNEYRDITAYSTSHNYGQIELGGNSLVKGKVVDYQNNTIVLSGVSVSLISGDLSYLTVTNSQGEFELNVSPTTYIISFEKTGYKTKEIQTLVSTYKDIGTITLKGSSELNGTVTDPTRLYPGTSLSGVSVRLVEEGGTRIYSTTTSSAGFYQLYIPSDLIDYTITFNRNGFKEKTLDHSGDVTLTGATHIEGRVYDKYNNKNLDNVLVQFTDQYYNTFYETTTDSFGQYSIDLGVDSNYLIAAGKAGYQNKYLNFSESMGFPYDAGNSGAWDRVQNIPMDGSVHIYLRTIDDFSGDPIINSHICAKYLTDDCEYSQTTDNNGTVDFYVEGGKSYSILISSMGYPSQTIQASGDLSQTINLTAYAKVYVYDQYAEEAFKKVSNAGIVLLYGSNTTSFNYILDETNATVRVTCDGLQRDGINVTLNGITKTTSGSNNVTFHHVPVGTYNIQLNGNQTGCGIDTKTITIDEGGKPYVFPEDYYAYNLNKTILVVKVVNPNGEGLEGGTVTTGSYTANETGSGIYNFTYITGGVYQVQASVSKYYTNTSTYQVTPGALNNYTTNPIVLKPHPGDLSVYVDNSTNALSSITVKVSNGTTQTLYTTGGWANFTNLISFYDVEVNGTSEGYSYNLTQNFFVEPEQTNYLYVTLNKTSVIITVKNQTSDNVEGANVTIWNGSQIATSADGTSLTSLTDSNGQVSFSRVKLFTYNLTIYKENYTQLNTSMRPDFEYSSTWEKTYYLNTTQLEVTVTDEQGNPLENTYLSLYNSTLGYFSEGYTDSDGKYIFDVSTGGGGYELFADGIENGHNYTEKNVILLENTLNQETIVLTLNILNVTVRDSLGNLVVDGVVVRLCSISNTTSSGFAMLYGTEYGNFLQKDLSANGTKQGYGYNETNASIPSGYSTFEIILNITRLTVHVVNSTGDPIENANVSILNLTTGVVETNGKGQYMNGTSNSNGNITFSYIPIGEYNVSVEKTPIGNSSVYVLTPSAAGENNSITIDPDNGTTTPSPTLLDDPPLLFTITNSTGSSIEGVNVSVINRTDGSIVDSGLTNNSGQVVLNVWNNTVYNFVINGEAVGYGKYIDYTVPVGYTNITQGVTDQNGEASIEVDGRTNYYVQTDTEGYDDYSDIEYGTVRNGTYDDDISSNPNVRSSIQIPLRGISHITGVVYDYNFLNPIEFDYEPVQSLVQIYYSSDCTGNVRYEATTPENGTYEMYVNPYQVGSDTQMLYCMKTTGSGFSVRNEYNLQFSAGDVYKNISMTGSGIISGYVKEVVTEKPLDGVDVVLRSASCYGGYSNCEAYENTTGSSGHFYFTVNSNSGYQPFDVLLNRTNYFSLEKDNDIYSGNTTTYYLIPLGKSILNLNVTGSNITENVTIKWKDEIYTKDNEYCSLKENVLSCLIPSGQGTLVINGSSIGYGVYSELVTYTAGENYTENVKLNETIVNITLRDEEGNYLDNITVTFDNLQNQSENGTVTFEKILAGIHNITFSGNLTKIYAYENNTAQVNVTNPGEVNNYVFVFNETQLYVKTQNETGAALSGIQIFLERLSDGSVLENTTNSTGEFVFRGLEYGNYTISFNATQLEALGYQDKNESVEVLLGKDASYGNNKTLVVKDTEVRFNLTNSTGSPLQNINVTLLQNGVIAQNGYGSSLTALSDSNGLVVFHNVISNNYAYELNGNLTGYGVYTDSISVPVGGANVTAIIPPLSINVTVKDQSGSPLEANVTLYKNNQIATDTQGNYLTENSTNGFSLFDYIYAGVYNLTVTKENYTSYSENYNLTSGAHSTTVTLTEITQSTTTTTTTTTSSTTTTTIPGGGHSGGGGGISTPVFTKEVTEESVDISGLSLASGKSKTIEIEGWEGFYKIVIQASQTIYNGKIKIEKLNPWEVWEAPDPTMNTNLENYQYFKITTEGIDGRTSNVEVYFSVDRNWVEQNSIENIKLWKYDTKWEELPTEEIERTSSEIKYKAKFSDFSYFAILGEEVTHQIQPHVTTTTIYSPVCGNGICENGEDYDNCPDDCGEAPRENWLWLFALIGAVGVIAVAVLIVKKVAKTEKPKKIPRLPQAPPTTKIKNILSNPEKYAGKKIRIDGKVDLMEFLPDEDRNLYRIRDSTGEIKGLSKRASYDGLGIAEGIVKKKNGEIYIEF